MLAYSTAQSGPSVTPAARIKPTWRGVKADQVPHERWIEQTLTGVFLRIANLPLTRVASTGHWGDDADTFRWTAASSDLGAGALNEPQSLLSLSACAVARGSEGRIETIEQAMRSQRREFDLVVAGILPEKIHECLVQGPRLLADHMVRGGAPLTPQTLDVLYIALRSLPKAQALALAAQAVRAGMPTGLMRAFLGLTELVNPAVWDLEFIAMHTPAVENAVATGMPLRAINETYGPFTCAPVFEHLDLLFCETWAAQQLAAGEDCESVLQNWAGDWHRPLEEPTDLRLVVFRDEPDALRSYELQHDLRPDSRVNFGHAWAAAHGPARCDAQSGMPVSEILSSHGLPDSFRLRLELVSCRSCAGREVFAGRSSPGKAMQDYQLTSAVARWMLQRIYEAGAQERGAHLAPSMGAVADVSAPSQASSTPTAAANGHSPSERPTIGQRILAVVNCLLPSCLHRR